MKWVRVRQYLKWWPDGTCFLASDSSTPPLRHQDFSDGTATPPPPPPLRWLNILSGEGAVDTHSTLLTAISVEVEIAGNLTSATTSELDSLDRDQAC